MLVVAEMEIRSLTENMSEEEFFAFCQANRDLQIERDKEGNVIVMSPTGSKTGNFNARLNGELYLWNKENRLGFVFDSSSGFKLPNGAIRSPDASWVSQSRWEALSEADRNRFASICPDFVAGVRSASDSLERLKAKMSEYMAQGCKLGWLIDLEQQQVWIFHADSAPTLLEGFSNVLSGEEVLPGFHFDLSPE